MINLKTFLSLAICLTDIAKLLYSKPGAGSGVIFLGRKHDHYYTVPLYCMILLHKQMVKLYDI